MNFAKAHKATKIILALPIVAIVFAPSAWSQGMMEYGALMAMPKGMPGGDTIKNLTGGFGNAFGAIPNALPGQAAGSAPASIPASIAVVRPDGTVAVDPVKLSHAKEKAKGEQTQAEQILAKTGASQVELKQAEKLLRDAITLRNNIWGYGDVTIARLLNDLGRCYERLNQPAPAEECYQNALVYINKKYGLGSSERLDTFVNLAPLLVKEGKISDALGMQQLITLIKERKSGASDLGTIQARITWAGTAKVLDKPNAPDIYKQCLSDLDKAGSNISPDKASKLKSEIIPAYVEVLKKQGREEEAKEAAGLLSNAATGAAPAAQPAQGAPSATSESAPPAAPASGSAAATAGAVPPSSAVQSSTPAAPATPAATPQTK